MQVREIRVKEGVRFIGEHFSPEVSIILKALFNNCPGTTDGFMWITEGWRPARHPKDLHTQGRAFDVRIHNLLADTHAGRVLLAQGWVAASRLDIPNPAHQFEIHGATVAQYHIHAEYDPK